MYGIEKNSFYKNYFHFTLALGVMVLTGTRLNWLSIATFFLVSLSLTYLITFILTYLINRFRLNKAKAQNSSDKLNQ